MAFDNSVPYTIDGTIDTNTNLITFVVSKYDLNRATNKYDLLQWTETFAIPAGACGYKRNTNQVFIVENNSQDEFSIYQGWYDVQANVTYSSITVALDNMVDALVAQQTGGGGGATIYTQLTEAAAITLIGSSGFERGATYRITLDGTSEGNNGDYFYGTAITTSRLTCTGYYHVSETAYAQPDGYFDVGGMHFMQTDPTVTISNPNAAFDAITDTLALGTYEPFGQWPIAINATENLETITGGFEGMEITIFATGGGGEELNILNTGNIKISISTGGTFILTDDNITFFKVKKRGSDWIQIGQLAI